MSNNVVKATNELFGPVEKTDLVVNVVSNGVIVRADYHYSRDNHIVTDVAVFNDPADLADWMRTWAKRRLQP